MSSTVSYYIDSLAWNSVTYDCDTGGPLEVRIDHDGDELLDRSGCDNYPTFGEIVNRMVRVTFRIREVKFTTALATKSDMTIVLKTKASTVTITIPDMMLSAVRMTQAKSVQGDCELTFVHVSDDGTTNPIS